MPRAKTPRTTSTNKQVITMPEAGSVPSIRRGAAASTPTPINLEEQIRLRAYAIFEQRGCIPGHENEDWLQAEREVMARADQQFSA